MSKQTIELNVSATLLLIANEFASREETRYYLNGVDIRPHAGGDGVLLTATDGVSLFAAHDPDGHVSQPIILHPAAGLLRAIKSPDFERWPGTRAALREAMRLRAKFPSTTPSRSLAKLVVPFGDDVVTRETVGGGMASLIDGKYPNVNRVLPTAFEIQRVAVSNKTMEQVCKAAKELATVYGGGDRVSLGMALQSAGPGVIRVGTLPVLIVTMPLRREIDLKDERVIPAWMQWSDGSEPVAEAAE